MRCISRRIVVLYASSIHFSSVAVSPYLRSLDDVLLYASTHGLSPQLWRMKLSDLPIRNTFWAKSAVMMLGTMASTTSYLEFQTLAWPLALASLRPSAPPWFCSRTKNSRYGSDSSPS